MKRIVIGLGIALTPPALADEVATSSTATLTADAPVAEDGGPLEALSARLGELEDKTNDLIEGSTELKNVVDVLARVKLTAYLQARFEQHGDSADGVSAANKPTTTTQFLLRRGRVKATWSLEVAEAMVQLDATPKGVVLKDAEATFIEPWTGWGVRFTGGQFKWPFGYEVLQSSEFRAMPERSRVIRALFPGERDRGFRVQALYEWLRFSAAVVNGNGTEDGVYGASDANGFKDVVGRLGVDLDWLAVGVSGYLGEGLATKLNGADPATVTPFTKSRLGADAQLYLDIPSLGGLALKAELLGGTEAATAPWGFYAQLSQALGQDLAVFARYDLFDPDLHASGDVVHTIGGGAQYFFSGYFKASLSYEHPITPTEVYDDTFTAQLQVMFF